MQASLSQPNHQDSTKHLKGVCVCAQVSRATRKNMYKVQIGYPVLAVPSLAS